MPKPGDKSQAFIRTALEVASQNPDILPRVFNKEEIKRDVDLVEAMKPMMLAMIRVVGTIGRREDRHLNQ